jgi:hypothetical protein
MQAGNAIAAQPVRLAIRFHAPGSIPRQTATVHANPQRFVTIQRQTPNVRQRHPVRFGQPGETAGFIPPNAVGRAHPHFLTGAGQQDRDRRRHLRESWRGTKAALLPNE